MPVAPHRPGAKAFVLFDTIFTAAEAEGRPSSRSPHNPLYPAIEGEKKRIVEVTTLPAFMLSSVIPVPFRIRFKPR